MAGKGKRFFIWLVLSMLLLSGAAALFAAKGARPVPMGGTGETSAYAIFLSILYILDCVCLCLTAGMKRQPAFLAALAAATGLTLAFPGWWGAPFYGGGGGAPAPYGGGDAAFGHPRLWRGASPAGKAGLRRAAPPGAGPVSAGCGGG